MRNQLGYLIEMVEKHDNCNIVHFGSKRCKLIAISVMEAEIQYLVLGFDYIIIIKDLIEEIVGSTLQLEAMMDS